MEEIKKGDVFNNVIVGTSTMYPNPYELTVIDENDNLVYNYRLVTGISHIKGGIKVLKQMEYAKDMIDKINID